MRFVGEGVGQVETLLYQLESDRKGVYLFELSISQIGKEFFGKIDAPIREFKNLSWRRLTARTKEEAIEYLQELIKEIMESR